MSNTSDYSDLSSFDYELDEIDSIMESVPDNSTEEVIRIVMYTLIFAIGLLANILVLIVIASDNAMRKKSGTIFTFQLALVDAIMLAFLPFHIHYIKTQAWRFGHIFCRLTNSVQFFNTFVVIFTLTAMAFDRYCTVVSNSLTKRIARYRSRNGYYVTMTCLTWILGAVMALPVFARSQIQQVGASDDEVQCGVYWGDYANCTERQARHCECGFLPSERRYKNQLLAFTFAIPFSIIFFCYFNIARIVVKSDKRSHTGHSGLNAKTISLLKMITALVCSYLFCWIPFYIYNGLVNVNRLKGLACIRLYVFYDSCIWLHPATNPIFYAFLGQQFKGRLKKVLPCCAAISTSWISSAHGTVADAITTKTGCETTHDSQGVHLMTSVSPSPRGTVRGTVTDHE